MRRLKTNLMHRRLMFDAGVRLHALISANEIEHPSETSFGKGR